MCFLWLFLTQRWRDSTRWKPSGIAPKNQARVTWLRCCISPCLVQELPSLTSGRIRFLWAFPQSSSSYPQIKGTCVSEKASQDAWSQANIRTIWPFPRLGINPCTCGFLVLKKKQKDVNLYHFLIAQSSLLFCLNVLPSLSKSWHQRHGYLSWTEVRRWWASCARSAHLSAWHCKGWPKLMEEPPQRGPRGAGKSNSSWFNWQDLRGFSSSTTGLSALVDQPRLISIAMENSLISMKNAKLFTYIFL